MSDQLQSAIEKACGAYPGHAQELADAIRREIATEVERILDERADDAYLAAVAAQPPAIAVGTRAREVDGTREGTVTFVNDTHVSFKWDGQQYTSSLRLNTSVIEPLTDATAPDAALPAGVTVNDEFTIYDDNDVGTAITFTISETQLEITPDSADMETSIDIERAVKLHAFLGHAIEKMKANAIAYKREQQEREMNKFKEDLGGSNGRD